MRSRSGFVLLLTLLLTVFLSALAARWFVQSLRTSSHTNLLLERLTLYSELQAIAVVSLQQLRGQTWATLHSAELSLPPAADFPDWAVHTQPHSEDWLQLRLHYQPDGSTNLPFEVLLRHESRPLTSLAFHLTAGLPARFPSLQWANLAEQQLVEASLERWIWLDDAIQEPTYTVELDGSQTMIWNPNLLQTAADNISLAAPVALRVNGDLRLHLPTASAFPTAAVSLHLRTTGRLTLQSQTGDTSVGFSGFILAEGPDCLQWQIAQVYWKGSLVCAQSPDLTGTLHLQAEQTTNWFQRQVLKPNGVMPLID